MTEFEDRELIDIYSEDRQSKGYKKPRHGEGSKLLPDEYMIYALGLIENRSGKFLITRRTLDKKWAAGAWEIPGGGVSAGETSAEAIQREVFEETHLDITDHYRLLYSYKNTDLKRGDNYFTDIYLCEMDFTLDDVIIQKDEVLDVKCADLDEITRLHDSDGFLHYERLLEALNSK